MGQPDELTDAAKAEIAAAIAIVREDRFERHVRTTLGKHAPAPTPTPTPAPTPKNTPPTPPTPPPPPPKPEPTPEPAPAKSKSLWWGDQLD